MPEDVEIKCVSDLLCHIKKKRTADRPLLYYRGLKNDTYDLIPSVRQDKYRCKDEGEMLRDLMTRQPDQFSKYTSALDRWMLAQHYGLPTRFLDISANPLVGLYFACGGLEDDKSKDKTDGSLYVFATTRDRVKPYDSDSVSIIANFARLRCDEQEAILKTTKEFLSKQGAFIDQCRCIMRPEPQDVIEEIRCYHAGCMKTLRQANEASGRYSYMGRLQTFIEQEKPYFVKDLIKPRDLFRIFIVQPRRLFPRVRAQSGAFLVSAFHKRFDFDSEKKNSQYGSDKYDVPYDYYRFRVKADDKESIREELKSLDISTETLFPGLESSAKAIKGDDK